MPSDSPEAQVRTLAVAACLVSAAMATPVAAQDQTGTSGVQTIIFIRHAEKPSDGRGMLNCRGLNRALLLPSWFEANIPAPDHIFAPNPSVKATEISGDGLRYDYVRPLLTIGPTAIRFGLPINTQLPYNDPGLLADTLTEPAYRDDVSLVAWEHNFISATVMTLHKRFASNAPIASWKEDDFSSVVTVTIDWTAEPATLDLSTTAQDFATIDEACPS